ncbi:MAG: DUF262 domain-containing protein [Solirubrobacteraceae bacterium]
MTGRAATTFDSTVEELWKLIGQVSDGTLQLPEFQRDWVWDDERIRSLLASVSVGYPIGTLMLLQTGNPEVRFKARPIQGALATSVEPERMLLDGQQRMTSLYQALACDAPVQTQDDRKKPIQRWYYIDMRRALDQRVDRDEAIISVPVTRQQRTLHDVVLDVSSEELEWEQCLFPLRLVFGPHAETRRWLRGLERHGLPEEAKAREDLMDRFDAEVLKAFEGYLMPTIVLGKESPKDAVCQVFEKVNTGGVSLTVFELLTATFAADDFDLREDWKRTHEALAAHNPMLRAVEATDFLQTIALLTTYDARRRWDERALSNGEVEEDGRPAVSCKRRDVLRLTLEDYEAWRELAVRGFEYAGRLLTSQYLFTPKDLPYRTQLVPLAAIFAVLGHVAEEEAVKAKLRRWYWCGVFGELYGSATETRFARDLPEVVSWVGGGPEPDTVAQANFAPGRLHTLRRRQSAAYKGLYALLMRDGARDFRTGETIQLATYFDEQVDIHHIFPQGWFKDQGIDNPVMDSVVNKTPLSKLTNIQIGKKAPSVYLSAIEAKYRLSREELDAILRTHVIDPEIIRTDDFDAFYAARFEELLQRIEAAMGKPIPREPEEASASAGQESVDYEGAAAADGPLSTVGTGDELASVS